jgi:LDH2 family malate/lactate/ureidoglycolate dehydrogenase
MPGEIEERTKAQRQRDGIVIDPTTWDQILTAAEKVGLGRERMERLGAAD